MTLPGPRARPWLAVLMVGLLASGMLLAAWLSADWVIDGPFLLLGCMVAGYAVGAWLPALAAGGAVTASAVALTAANQWYEPGAYPVADDLVFFLLMVGGAAVAGAVLTRRRRELHELDALRSSLVSRREAELRAARVEEQQRVEVECHRRLAEQLGGVVLVAEGARHHRSPDEVTRVLVRVEDAARQALAELREVVGTLRRAEPGLPDHGEPADNVPALPPRPEPSDLLLAGVLGGSIAVECVIRDAGPGPVWLDVLAALLVCAPLAWRRSHPLPALVLCLLLATGMTGFVTPLTATVTALALVLVTGYAAGAYVRPWPLGLLVVWGSDLAQAWAGNQLGDGATTTGTVAVSTLPFLAGLAATAAAGRARRLRALLQELEHSRDAELREAVAATRLELARELHDTVAYSMTVTCLQAAAAQGCNGDPGASLDAILVAARESMGELRAGLDEIDGWDAPLDADALGTMAARAGLVVRWSIDPAALPTGRAATLVRRVLRECFTNAARHAPGAEVAVRLARNGDILEVEVVDDGPRGTAHGGGTASGLAGLAELVSDSGGQLSAGPGPGHGFRVAATLPLGSAVPA